MLTLRCDHLRPRLHLRKNISPFVARVLLLFRGRPLSRRPRENGSFETSSPKVGPHNSFQIGSPEVGTLEMREPEVGTLEMREPEVGAFEISSPEVSALEVRVSEPSSLARSNETLRFDT
jgi:hypothetical protein